MTKYCPHCGTPLRETTQNKLWCPNCFEIKEERTKIEDSDLSYIGKPQKSPTYLKRINS